MVRKLTVVLSVVNNLEREFFGVGAYCFPGWDVVGLPGRPQALLGEAVISRWQARARLREVSCQPNSTLTFRHS